ncbi:MAG: VIT domain-containing protein [Polyangiaceae bacterium]
MQYDNGPIETEEDSPQSATLEHNVERLLRSARELPTMRGDAQKRILERLLAEQRTRSSSGDVQKERREPRPEGAPHNDKPDDDKLVKPRVVALRPAPQARMARLGRGGLVAGALALAASVTGFLMSDDPIKSSVATFENTALAPKEILLGDGTRVTLDAGAKLVETSRRSVELVRGQAIFDVTKGADFTVTTPTGKAIALGTRFLVNVTNDETKVAVAKGRVELRGQGGNTATVLRGEQGILHGSEAPRTEPAPRLSHLFGFARKADLDSPSAPTKRGTLMGRAPGFWGGERPLEVRDFTVDVVVEDGVARTTVDQTYFNPVSQQLEGVYSFPMPHGAAVSRLAMYVDGQRMEAAVVDRSRGRDIYEGIVERRRDPALLEWMSGNTFRMRVFPLPARTEKRVFLSYTQVLEHTYEQDRLTVPIPPIDQVAGHAKFKVRIAGGNALQLTSPSHSIRVDQDGQDALVSFEQSDYRLGQDFVLNMNGKSTAEDRTRTFTEGSSRYWMARSAPDLRHDAPQKPVNRRRYAILFDTSASRGEEDLAAQARFVDGFLDAVDSDDEVSVIALDHTARSLGAPVAARDIDRQALARQLRAESEGIGDSRLDLGFDAALRTLDGAVGDKVVVYVGDGVFVNQSSASVTARDLASKLAGRARFFGVGIGDTVDRNALDSIADATQGLVVSLGEDEDLEHSALDLVSTSYGSCISMLHAEVQDAAGHSVQGAIAEVAARTVCDGDRIDVIARVPKGERADHFTVRGEIDGVAWEKTYPLSSAEDGARYLPRLFAERRVQALLREDPLDSGRTDSPHAKEITDLATTNFLVTPFTSLLVLENDEMYKQFGVEKRDPTGWAVYDAPKTVAVKSDWGASRASTLNWDVLERTPTQLFNDNSVTTRGFGWRYRSSLEQGFGSGSGGFNAHFGRSERRAAMDGDVDSGALRTQAWSGELASGPQPVRRATRPLASASARFEPEAASTMPAAVDLARADLGAGLGTIGTLGKKGKSAWRSDAISGGYLMAFNYSNDPRFDDMTEFVPSLFGQGELEYAQAIAAVSDGAAVHSDAAMERLKVARDRASGQSFALGSTRTTVSTDGSIEVEQTLPTQLVELARVDERGLSFTYPELGLRTRRDDAVMALVWLSSNAPFTAPPEALLTNLTVEEVDSKTVRVRAPGDSADPNQALSPRLEIEFDEHGDVAAFTWIVGSDRQRTQLDRKGNSLVVKSDSGSSEYRIEPVAPSPSGNANIPVAPPTLDVRFVEVSLPLENPRFYEPGGAGEKLDAATRARQLMATYTALKDPQKVAEQAEALLAATTPSRGDLVLASSALPSHPDLAKRLLKGFERDDDVADYLRASAKPYADKPTALQEVERKHPNTLVGALSAYRGVLIATETDSFTGKSILTRVGALNTKFPEARWLRYAAVKMSADRIRWREANSAVALWDTLASDVELGPIADREAAFILQQDYSHSREAANRFIRSFDAMMDRGDAAPFDYGAQNILRQGRGEAGLEIFMSRWRSRVIESGTGEQVLELIAASLGSYGQPVDATAVSALARKLETAALVDDDVRLQAARMLVAANFAPEARVVLAPMLNRSTPPAPALELAARAATTLGDLNRAASLYDTLLRTTQNSSVSMNDVTGWYRELVRLELRRAGMTSGDAAKDALEKALSVAARWRREDPGNAEIDELCASTLFSMGKSDEALRHLSSIVERQPADGSAWGRVAGILERQGDLEGALAALEKAAAVEPTNPGWFVRRGSLLLARDHAGDRTAAKGLFTKVIKGTWQDRYWSDVNQARMLGELE